jgi:hypothetical protein
LFCLVLWLFCGCLALSLWLSCGCPALFYLALPCLALSCLLVVL